MTATGRSCPQASADGSQFEYVLITFDASSGSGCIEVSYSYR